MRAPEGPGGARQQGFALALLLALLSVFGLFGVGFFVYAISGQGPDSPVFWRLATHPAVSAQDDEFFAHREVPAGTPQPWSQAARPLQSAALEDIIRQAAPQGLTGLLIVQGGQLTFERYFGGRDERSLYPSFSMSKSVVSLLTGLAWQEGRIHSLDDPAARYVPELQGAAQGRITIRQLLSMKTGLETTQDRSGVWQTLTGPEARLYFGPDLLGAIRLTPVKDEPGGRWAYSNAGVGLLGLVVSRATGQSLSAYFSQKLWQPLGAEHSAWWSLDRAGGQEKAFAGLGATARDYARLGQLVLQGGRWQGRQLVPADYLVQALQPVHDVAKRGATPTSQYGFLFWLHPPYAVQGGTGNQHRYVAFEGHLGQVIAVVPYLEAVVVIFNDTDTTNRVSLAAVQAIVNTVLPAQP